MRHADLRNIMINIREKENMYVHVSNNKTFCPVIRYASMASGMLTPVIISPMMHMQTGPLLERRVRRKAIIWRPSPLPRSTRL